MISETARPTPFERLRSVIEDRTEHKLLTPLQIEQQTGAFVQRFGPAALKAVDGEALLRLMHGRLEGDPKCLAYWLEFKNDLEFEGHRFGSIGGGSALKFGLFQRPDDGTWLNGSPKNQTTLGIDAAIALARQQRDELLAGSQVLASLSSDDVSDAVYSALQAAVRKAAPTLVDMGWAHKYWFLCHPDRIESFHSPRYQRFYELKMLRMPPDEVGIRSSDAPRFICAGRFAQSARDLDVPVATLCNALILACGAFHRYWKVGTTEGDAGVSHWPAMREGGFVSIGWPQHVGDLTPMLKLDLPKMRSAISGMLQPLYPKVATASRKAGEIINFASAMAENDIVLACTGQTVLGVGVVRGPYVYDAGLDFPHKRAVDWLLFDEWPLPVVEGPQTTVFELGRKAVNLLALEQRLASQPVTPRSVSSDQGVIPKHLPALDSFTVRVESTLRRKGQVILYGPPGTGKTYRAILAAQELAARHAFRKTFADLSVSEQAAVAGAKGLVRVCTFHPGWGYEDFVEGLRPVTIAGQMLFEPRDGVFKTLCLDAVASPDRHFTLIIDEINRGDLPRIFGELLTTLELDKRGKAVTLPTTGKAFAVPPNVSLIGTMNTADRSISLLDTALRRRFGFIELMPDSAALAQREVGGLRLGAWLDALNARIRKNLRRDARNLQIGHAYLMPQQPIGSIAEFARVVRDDIIPLLEEYCYDDFGTLQQILGIALVDVEGGRIRDEMFEANREEAFMQAVTFAETQALTLGQPVSDAPSTGAADEPMDGQDEEDDADVTT
ncbi:AAA family ATPase [Burkholderiales bacterium 8X]|nr:AAA family ATPase [Burkholderiales bacterium 8X]